MPVMVLLLVWYWVVMFWFRKSRLSEVLEREPDFEIFAGRIPKDPVEDLQRGRLVVYDGKLILWQRDRKTNTIKQVWSMKVSDVKTMGFGMLLPIRRKGVRIFTRDDNVEFICKPIIKRKDEFYKALGWEIPQIQKTETQTGR